MIIDKVTITGADNNTNPNNLLLLQKEFPFVEWGILISGSKRNIPRYPAYGWIDSLPNELNLSLHVCGKYVRNICIGVWDLPVQLTNFQRIQLNFSTYLNLIKEENFLKALTTDKHYIFQVKTPTDYIKAVRTLAVNNGISASFLYDKSGGKGVYESNWSPPIGYCGYAGGLNPISLEKELQEIESVVKSNTIWIDVESNVRTEDNLDLDKIREFLLKAKAYNE